MKRFQADAQQLSRPRFVVGSRKSLQYQLAFHSIYRRTRRKAQRGKVARSDSPATSEIVRQMALSYEVAIANDQRAFQYVAQFTDIARPGVTLKHFRNFGLHPADLAPVFCVEITNGVLSELGQ